jgi:hypothetical protein
VSVCGRSHAAVRCSSHPTLGAGGGAASHEGHGGRGTSVARGRGHVGISRPRERSDEDAGTRRHRVIVTGDGAVVGLVRDRARRGREDNSGNPHPPPAQEPAWRWRSRRWIRITAHEAVENGTAAHRQCGSLLGHRRPRRSWTAKQVSFPKAEFGIPSRPRPVPVPGECDPAGRCGDSSAGPLLRCGHPDYTGVCGGLI